MWFSWCTIFASLWGEHFGRGSTMIQHPFYYDCVEIFSSRNCMKSGSCPVSIIFLGFQNHLLCFLSFSMWKLLIIGPDFRRNITRKSDSPPAARRLYSYLWLARPLDSNAHYGWYWGYTTPLESLYQGLMGQHYPCKDIYPSFGPFIKLHHVHDLRWDLQSDCPCWFQWISRDYKTFELCSQEQIIVCGRARESIHLGKSKGFFTGTFSFKKPTPATGFKPAARQWGFKWPIQLEMRMFMDEQTGWVVIETGCQGHVKVLDFSHKINGIWFRQGSTEDPCSFIFSMPMASHVLLIRKLFPDKWRSSPQILVQVVKQPIAEEFTC